MLSKDEWIFAILLSLFVIRINFRATWSTVERLMGYMVRESWEQLLYRKRLLLFP